MINVLLERRDETGGAFHHQGCKVMEIEKFRKSYTPLMVG
jgi:hypothetical protein